MTKLTENNLLGKAYMLDKNENLIPVKYHPYGYKDDIEENSSCVYFLYKYTTSEKIKDKAEQMLFDYMLYCFTNSDENIWELENIKISDNNMFKKLFKLIFKEYDMFNTLASWAINLNEFDLFKELYEIFLRRLVGLDMHKVSDISDYEIYADNVEAYLALNEDYVRVRIGGRYDNDKEDCIYFRISSIGYDWGDTIMNVVFKTFLNKVGYITIERDLESANLNRTQHKVYKTKDGQLIDHLPIKDFVYQEHIPLVASMNKNNIKNVEFELLPLIESGYSILEARRYLPKSVMLYEYRFIVKEQLKSFRKKKNS